MLCITAVTIVLSEYQPAIFFVLPSQAHNLGTTLPGIFYQLVNLPLFSFDRPTPLKWHYLDLSPSTPSVRVFVLQLL